LPLDKATITQLQVKNITALNNSKTRGVWNAADTPSSKTGFKEASKNASNDTFENMFLMKPSVQSDA